MDFQDIWPIEAINQVVAMEKAEEVSECRMVLNKIKLSIVTINLNNLEGLKKTMESVFTQICRDFEYIVIDGASTDGSAEYIREHSDRLTYWVSEMDTGIYNAMNNGVRAANGEYVLMLNSGDYLVDESVISKVIPELDGTDIVQGNAIIEKGGNHYIHRGYGHSEITFLEAVHSDLPHQALFARKSLFETNGYFDESYRIISDTIFLVKNLAFGNTTFKYVDLNVAFFVPDGISQNQSEALDKEHQRMHKELMSDRLNYLCTVEEKKIVLWEKLHSSRFLWYGTMALVHLYDLFHKKQKRALRADKSDKYVR